VIEQKSSCEGGELCLEEMAQALTGMVRELGGDWGGAAVGVEWVEIALVQVPVGVAYVPVVEQGFLTRQGFLAMM
jgi:hypothetical protein